MLFAAKTIVAALVISFASWLAGKRPELAGFIIALPLSTMLALMFTFAEFGDPKASVTFAKSVFVAVPLSMTFFIPFLLADKLNLGFLACYGLGVAFLTIAYFAHRFLVSYF